MFASSNYLSQEKITDQNENGRSDSEHRILKTTALYCAFFADGLAYSITAPSIVSMEILLETDTKSFSAAFSGHSLGYLTGAVVCGFIYARINKELLFILSLLGIFMTTLCAPYSTHLYVFVGACVGQGISMGLLDPAGQTYLINLWEGQKYKKPALLLLHTIFSTGSTVGPFILKPFLVDIQPAIIDNATIGKSSEILNLQNTSYLSSGNAQFNEEGSHTSTPNISKNEGYIANDSLKEEVSVIRIGYTIVAGLVLVSVTLFAVTFFISKPACRDWIPKKQSNSKVAHTKSHKHFRVLFLTFVFSIMFAFQMVMSICGSFLAVFVVKGLGWPNNYGALITTTFWAANGCSKLFSIPFFTIMSPRNITITSVTITIAGLISLLFVPLCEVIVWIGVVITALGLGPNMACFMLWTDQYIEFNGIASSLMSSSMSLSGIFAPMTVGFLFEKFGHMVIVYMALSASILEIGTFTSACLYAQRNQGINHKSSFDMEHFEKAEVKPLNENVMDIRNQNR